MPARSRQSFHEPYCLTCVARVGLSVLLSCRYSREVRVLPGRGGSRSERSGGPSLRSRGLVLAESLETWDEGRGRGCRVRAGLGPELGSDPGPGVWGQDCCSHPAPGSSDEFKVNEQTASEPWADTRFCLRLAWLADAVSMAVTAQGCLSPTCVPPQGGSGSWQVLRMRMKPRDQQ